MDKEDGACRRSPGSTFAPEKKFDLALLGPVFRAPGLDRLLRHVSLSSFVKAAKIDYSDSLVKLV